MPQIDAETSALIIGASILAMVAGGWWLRSQSSETGTDTQLQQEAADTTLHAELKDAQEELESAYLTNKELKTTNAQLQQAANSPQQPNSQQQEASTNEALQSELTDAREEAELTLLQLHQVQEELEHYFLLSQELKTSSAISPEQQQRLSRCNERLEQLLLRRKQRDQRLAALIDRQQRTLQRAARLLQGPASASTPRRQSDVALI